MAKRSVTITAAWITGACAIVAAIILAVAQCLSVWSPGVEKPLPAVGEDSGRDSNAVGEIDTKQPMASYVGSFDDYISRLVALKDRNFERQEFLHSMEGKRVVWRGWVDRVEDIQGVTVVGIKASREDSAIEGVGIYFPSSKWRTKLYALRNGDQVEIDAVYGGGPVQLIPLLRGLSISLVEAK
jgi:hypothetical protein